MPTCNKKGPKGPFCKCLVNVELKITFSNLIRKLNILFILWLEGYNK